MFEKANAEIIDSHTVRVWSDYISTPTAASYAFYSATYSANLCSTEDGKALYPALPAISEQRDGMVYTTYLDWTDCDLEEIFHIRSGNVHISRYYPAWILGAKNTAQTSLAIDKTVMAQGEGSLKVNYSSAGIISVTPTMDAEKYGIYHLFNDTETVFSQYECLRFLVSGLSNTATFEEIVFTNTDGEKFTASSFVSTEGGEFDAVCVDLTSLTYASGEAADVSVLSDICAIEFVFETTDSAGTIYIDGVTFTGGVEA